MKTQNKVCLQCNDTGIIKYYNLDGMTIYKWMKPLERKCGCK